MPPRISETEAVALVAASPLLDLAWYAAQVGRTFGSRAEAAEHWVRHRPEDATPHPLFEPAWLYPRARWAKHAPDPLSFWLADPAERERSPHPLVDLTETGPLEEWLRGDSAPELVAQLMPEPHERDTSPQVSVVVTVQDLPRAVQWARHLARTPGVGAQLVTDDPAATRILTAVAATLPTVRVVAAPGTDPHVEVVVHVGPDVRPPRWPWVEDLVTALDADGVGAAVPLLLRPDFTVAGPVLVGHPVADVERAAHLPLPDAIDAPVRAARTDRGPAVTVLVPSARLITTRDTPDAADPSDPSDPAGTDWLAAAGFEAPGRPLRVRDRQRALRWSIDIAAPAAPRGRRWGDWHFARSLADALERQGQWVAIDHPETRGRASRDLDDVTLVLRGLERVTPPAHTATLLWVISHPDLVTPDELAAYDAAYAASATWAARHGIDALPQCTDATRFHPDVPRPGQTSDGPRALFVGNSRGELRASVAAAQRTGLDLTVIGQGWPDDVPVAADHVANADLPSLYASAGIVLNDHWKDMRAEGFVSNRVFDVLATGARLLSDDVAGLADTLAEAGDAVRVWRTDDDFRRLTTGDPDEHWPDAAARRRTAERVVAEHSFDARAATLLARAVALVDSRP